jgi:hypothetical protein
MIRTSKTSSLSVIVQELSTEIHMRSFMLFFQFLGYVNFVQMKLESSCAILRRHLLDVYKVTMGFLAEHIAPCWVTAVTHSAFFGVQTEHARSTNLFTTLSQTLKLSTYFKLALCEGFLPCRGTSNSCQKHICICTIHIVSNKFSQQKCDDSLHTKTCMCNICFPHFNQLPTVMMWNTSHPCTPPCIILWSVAVHNIHYFLHVKSFRHILICVFHPMVWCLSCTEIFHTKFVNTFTAHLHANCTLFAATIN